MTRESSDRSSIIDLIAAVFSDVAALFQKEIQLARAEAAETFKVGLRVGVLFAIAGFLGLAALLFVLAGFVFALAASGLALYWSCFIVALAIGVLAAGLVLYARTRGRSLLPLRTFDQLRKDLQAAKDQLR